MPYLGLARLMDGIDDVRLDRLNTWFFRARYPAAIAEPITGGLRRSQASTFTGGSRARTAPLGPVVLLLSPDLDVRAQTQQTREYLRLLVPPDSDQDPIPAGAYNVGAQLLAREMGVDSQPALARVHFADGIWLTLRAARLDTMPDDQSDIAVGIEIASATDRLRVFSRAYGLSERENELLLRLAAGADTRTAASMMFVSEHTVQDYLKAVFSKTESHSRRTLLARALGQ
jgi:DNA-binding CsgD family transcriptional regulator